MELEIFSGRRLARKQQVSWQALITSATHLRRLLPYAAISLKDSLVSGEWYWCRWFNCKSKCMVNSDVLCNGDTMARNGCEIEKVDMRMNEGIWLHYYAVMKTI